MSEEKAYIVSLIKENDKLKDEIKKIKNDIEKIDNLRATYKMWNNEKRERIDKAIEYIKENQYQHEWTDRGGFRCTDDRYILNDSQDVINILEGKDE